MTKNRTARRLALPAAALTFALLTACGSSGDDDGGVASLNEGSASAAVDEDPAEAAEDFAVCLREQGINVQDPDPETGEIDFTGVIDGNRDALADALAACEHLAPPELTERAAPNEEQLATMEEFARCMRDNGVDIPDPDPVLGFDPGSIDRDAPGFSEAMVACEEYLTAFRGEAS